MPNQGCMRLLHHQCPVLCLSNCEDFDLCDVCEAIDGIHHSDHTFVKIRQPVLNAGRKRNGKLVPLLKRNLYMVDDDSQGSRWGRGHSLSSVSSSSLCQHYSHNCCNFVIIIIIVTWIIYKFEIWTSLNNCHNYEDIANGTENNIQIWNYLFQLASVFPCLK